MTSKDDLLQIYYNESVKINDELLDLIDIKDQWEKTLTKIKSEKFIREVKDIITRYTTRVSRYEERVKTLTEIKSRVESGQTYTVEQLYYEFNKLKDELRHIY